MMRRLFSTLCVAGLLLPAALGCRADAETERLKYVASGNAYFEQARYTAGSSQD